MLDFYRTPAGRKFFEVHLPALIEALVGIKDELAKARAARES